MVNTEREIISAMIFFKQHIPFILANLDEDSFFDSSNKAIFKKIVELYQRQEDFDIFVLMDLLPDHKRFFLECEQYVLGVGNLISQQFVLDRIKKLKNYRSKRELLAAITAELNYAEPDFEKIEEMARSGKVINWLKEDGDFRAAFEEYLESKEHERVSNITTGFPSFDKETGPYQHGEILAVMGRTTAGKTWVVLNIIANLCKVCNEKIGLFSLEMSKPAIVQRIMQIWYNAYWREIDEMRLAGEIHYDDFLAHYEQRLNVYGKIYSVFELEKIVEKDSLDIIVIDFLQLLKKERKAKSRYEQITNLMEELKQLAKTKNIFIILAVQVSREGKSGGDPVTIDMARESGTIEEDSDFIIGCWQPWLKDQTNEYWNGKMCMQLLKNKRGQVVGCEFGFDYKSGRIWETQNFISPIKGEQKPWKLN
jgi:replicative DNA helicase